MRLFLGIFFVVSFLVVFVLRTLLVWRTTGINPEWLPKPTPMPPFEKPSSSATAAT